MAPANETPSNKLWVGNVAADVTDSDLEEQFAPFGALDGVTSYSSRSYAFVLFKRTEDAASAKEALQGTTVRGKGLKIEFARPAKPCKKLWVGGISPSVSKEELEEEFLKFGKMENFKFLRDRNTACVEYFKLEDAAEAMRNMNGKRLGSDQIQLHVDFLRSQPSTLTSTSRREQWPDHRDGQFLGRSIMGPAADSHPGHKRKQHYSQSSGQPSGSALWVGYPPGIQIDEQMLHNAMILFGEIERIESFPSQHYSIVEFRSIDEAWRAKEGLQGRLFSDPRITIMFLSELPPAGPYHSGGKWSNPDVRLLNEHSMGILGPGALPQSPSGINFGPDDVPLRSLGPHPGGFDALLYNHPDGISKKRRLSPAGVRGSVGGPRAPDDDYIWRGIIAKGGTPICHARCVPLGKGTGIEIPEVVNCSARTGLDMLEKHYAEAIAFDIVFFLPDSEDDFASYTEFLHYLGAKNRAGVAKLDDGMTLFLVPPSDFLKTVLKVAGPERLYGVVLKFPQQVPTAASNQPQWHLPTQPSQYIEKQQIPPSHAEYSINPLKEEYVLPMQNHNRVLSEDTKLSSNPQFPHTNESSVVQSVTQDFSSKYSNGAAVSQAGHPLLTPELIASLATLLPGNAQPSLPEGAKLSVPETGSTTRPSFPSWQHDQQISDHSGHASQQLGSQYLQDQSLSQFQPTYSSVPNTSHYHSAPPVLGSTQMPDPSSVSLPHQQQSNFMVPSQGGGVAGSSHISRQHYVTEAPAVNSYMPSSGGNLQPDQTFVPLAAEKVNPEFPNQMQQLHSTLLGAGQSTSDGEAGKNHRYQSTLQFAAKLLVQLQQQQTGSQAGKGSGSHQ